jgi:murein DD-endopeptidase MepM/ murein hydrolase activator NlpD
MHPDIPEVALAAYVHAADLVGDEDPSCRPSWALLAAIGRVETDHGRHGGSSPTVGGDVIPPILGVVLDGRLPGTRPIPDTDDGRLDGDLRWDRALGPMQFLPGTWAAAARDGNGDGDADPHNLYDAAATAAGYLCRHAAGDITTPAGFDAAVRAYNRSSEYVAAVRRWMDAYLAEAVIPAGVPGTGAVACPVAGSVSFIDSWHFPRSGGRLHKGQDLFAAEGTPLVALADGTVTDVRAGAGLGGNIIWLHTSQGHWYYAHLHTFAAGLHVGQDVARGDVIGTVGRTGNARTTPPHLHIQWRPTGRHGADVNPYDVLSAACPGHRG